MQIHPRSPVHHGAQMQLWCTVNAIIASSLHGAVHDSTYAFRACENRESGMLKIFRKSVYIMPNIHLEISRLTFRRSNVLAILPLLYSLPDLFLFLFLRGHHCSPHTRYSSHTFRFSNTTMHQPISPISLDASPQPQNMLFIPSRVHTGVRPLFTAHIWVPQRVYQYMFGCTDVLNEVSKQTQCEIYTCQHSCGGCELLEIISGHPTSLARGLTLLYDEKILENDEHTVHHLVSSVSVDTFTKEADNSISVEKVEGDGLRVLTTKTLSNSQSNSTKASVQNFVGQGDISVAMESEKKTKVSATEKKTVAEEVGFMKEGTSTQSSAVKSTGPDSAKQSNGLVAVVGDSMFDTDTASEMTNAQHESCANEKYRSHNLKLKNDKHIKSIDGFDSANKKSTVNLNMKDGSTMKKEANRHQVQEKVEKDKHDSHPWLSTVMRSIGIESEKNGKPSSKDTCLTGSSISQSKQKYETAVSSSSYANDAQTSDHSSPSRSWISVVRNSSKTNLHARDGPTAESTDMKRPALNHTENFKDNRAHVRVEETTENSKLFQFKSPMAQHLLREDRATPFLESMKTLSGASARLTKTVAHGKSVMGVSVSGNYHAVVRIMFCLRAIDSMIRRWSGSTITTGLSLQLLWFPDGNIGRLIGSGGAHAKEMKDKFGIDVSVVRLWEWEGVKGWKAVVIVGEGDGVNKGYEYLRRKPWGAKS